ncbi:MAG: tetratricopeptide repeat protein, partial [Thermoanaerobaculia bacterium]
SPDPDNEFFSDGITEDIITQLSKIEGLKVISRTSIMRYRQTDKSLQEIARELDVATILEGTVRRAGERVRISAQLIDAQSDDNIWAETYDRNLTDIFAIQSEVAQQIASNLEAELSAEERGRIEDRPTTSLAAYDKYLTGRAHYYRYLPEDNEEAIKLFRSAIEEDPEFAAAWAALGDALGQLYLFDQDTETVEEALAASRKAIELKPELADGHKALGLAYFGKGWYQLSLRANRRAVELNPNFAPAIGNVGWTSLAIGDVGNALPWLQRAKVLDPSNQVNSMGLGLGFSMLGDQSNARLWLRDALDSGIRIALAHSQLALDDLYHDQKAEALQQARRGLEIVPEDPNLLCVAGVAALANNELAEARRYLEASIETRAVAIGYLQPFSAHTVLGMVLWSMGERTEAEELFESSLRQDRLLLDEKREDWAVPFDMASIHAIRGESSEALEKLQEAVTAGWRGWPVGENYPAFASLRDDLRFQRLTSDLQYQIEAARREALANEN